MPRAAPARTRLLATWFEQAPFPFLAVALLLLLIYWPMALLPPMVDDYRNLRLLREHAAKDGGRPGLYEFLHDEDQVRADRAAGYFPWWVQDGLRFRYFRPAAEWSLALDYWLFGPRPWGMRLTNFLLYLLTLKMLLAFYRLVGDERTARWAMLVFAVAGAHAATVVFPAARCDLLSACGAAGSLLLLAGYLRRGGGGRLAGSLAGLGLALASKESSLALAAAPLVLAFALREKAPDEGRRPARMALATFLFVALAGTVAAYIAHHRYGSDAGVVLDPLGAPAEYLRVAPLRALLLVASWLTQFNPLYALLKENWRWTVWPAAVVGAAALVLFGRMSRREWNNRPLLGAMAAWPLLFMPILVCSMPDDRILMLPAVGVAYVAATWLIHARPGGAGLNRLPLALFLLGPFIRSTATVHAVDWLEGKTHAQIRTAAESFGRPTRADDHVFYVNGPQVFFVFWLQDRASWVLGPDGPHFTALCDVSRPRISPVGPNILRLEATNESLLSSYVGQIGRRRGQPRRTGDRIDLEEYSVVLTDVQDGRVRAMEVTFRHPLDWDGYRFFELRMRGPASQRTFSWPPASPSTLPAREQSPPAHESVAPAESASDGVRGGR